MTRPFAAALAAAVAMAPALSAQAWRENPVPPPRVAVRPVFLIAPGAPGPTASQRAALLRHLRIARGRYTELLGERDSFALDTSVVVASLARPIAFYRDRPALGVPELTSELLDHLRVSRFACPWVLFAVVIGAEDDYPTGAGEPLNGGLDNGGGIVVLSAFALDRIPHVQSTIQHELGHGFGLPHVDAYGRDMQTDPSLMSYTPAHHTNGFEPTAVSGLLVAEDIRALARNHRVFAHLTFDPARDAPVGRAIAPRDIMFGPMDIPGQPAARIAVTTPSGELYGSHAENVLQNEVLPSAGPGVTFDATRMWHSDSSAAGWVNLDVEFPVSVTLSRVGIYTQHSGRYHVASRARIHLLAADNVSLVVADAPLAGPDAEVSFVASTGRRWRIELLAGERGQVTVRGLRFWSGADELVWGRW